MRILQTANVIAPETSGTATMLAALARGYREAGHTVVQLVLGDSDRRTVTADAEMITVAAPRIPGTDYRMMAGGRRMLGLLDEIDPDRIEVYDRFTLQAVGRWALRHDVPTLAVSHERLDAVLASRTLSPRLARALADFWNLRIVVSLDSVVCATSSAAREFERVGVENLVTIRPGVDLATFTPDRRSHELRRTLAAEHEPLLVMAHPLMAGRQPELAIDTVRELHRAGLHARLVVAGDGPLLDACRRRAAGLPVSFVGHIADRAELAQLLATADVLVAPGAADTFGLAALEALACGTPVVGHRGGALPELLDVAAGAVTDGHPRPFATAVMRLLAMDEACRRAAARAHAERFGWSATVAQMLAAHRVELAHAAA